MIADVSFVSTALRDPMVDQIIPGLRRNRSTVDTLADVIWSALTAQTSLLDKYCLNARVTGNLLTAIVAGALGCPTVQGALRPWNPTPEKQCELAAHIAMSIQMQCDMFNKGFEAAHDGDSGMAL
jgi:hypothetical protein